MARSGRLLAANLARAAGAASSDRAPARIPAMPRRDPVDHRLLQRLCYDVLQRGPTPAELRSFQGADAAVVVPRLLQSREAMAAWLEEELQYFLLLDQFRPKGEAFDRMPARLQK